MEKDENKGFIKDVEVVLKEIELKTNYKNEEQIDKVVFHTEGGEITWKPKFTKQTFEAGFKVTRQVSTERDLLPKKLLEMASLVSEKGQIRVKISYSYWKTEQDDKPVTYRYITSEKTFDTWVVLDEKVQQEKVLP